MKICRVCGVELTDFNWFPSLKKKNSAICRTCNNERMNIWRNENRELANEMSLKHYRKNPKAHHARVTKSRQKSRINIIIEYGGKCNKCGINDFEVLDLDHINNDGAADRKRNLFAYNLYRKLKKDGYPKDRHQLLCKNCNWKKELERRKSSV